MVIIFFFTFLFENEDDSLILKDSQPLTGKYFVLFIYLRFLLPVSILFHKSIPICTIIYVVKSIRSKRSTVINQHMQ